ncbi:hypothetical protein B296_00017480, partial [Ensete ventricosum]
DCVGIGMGDMSEGRKCVECLGRRFSQSIFSTLLTGMIYLLQPVSLSVNLDRYIKRAGHAWCCWRLPNRVKLQELKWAEKGPRRSGEKQYRSQAMPAGSPRHLHVRFGTSHDSSAVSFVRSPSPHGFPL